MHAAPQQHERNGLATVGAGGAGYRRHRPEETVLYDVVEQHADAFFEGQEERGRSLPRFVREEFEAYLTCGRLERGFIRDGDVHSTFRLRKLNLNVHLHVLVFDGAYSFEHGKVHFHRAGALRSEEIDLVMKMERNERIRN